MSTNKSKEGGKADLQSLEINDTIYQTLLTDKYQNRKPWQPRNEKQVLGVLPGTIQDINVSKGSSVKKGEIVLTYVAMKMVNTVKSPVSGTVKDIFVAAGDKFPKGELLLEFE
ncbi:MAG: acetyl-CoA carboxylase biotin carboxyl carrier protein subunit [Bacteroidota bacterium]|nr:acetyl-CoA carboxylase biotin carboxyl carrier protein subunit [Bacteroidota bacterium]